MQKVAVEYRHDPTVLEHIYLAIVPMGRAPKDSEWQPALRDTVRGKRIVWARFDDDVIADRANKIWLKDQDGPRAVALPFKV